MVCFLPFLSIFKKLILFYQLLHLAKTKIAVMKITTNHRHPLCTCLLCFKNATGFIGQRSLLHWATKPTSFANEAYCVF